MNDCPGLCLQRCNLCHQARHSGRVVDNLPDPACLADCLAHRVRVLTRGFGQLAEAMPDAEEALHLARDAGNPKRLAEALVAALAARGLRGAMA